MVETETYIRTLQRALHYLYDPLELRKNGLNSMDLD